MKRTGSKHKLCRRIGSCVWGDPKCPSVKRPYMAGMHGRTRRKKQSTYAELLLEKQKLRTHYDLTEKQLRIAYKKAKAGQGVTGDKLLNALETRLASVVYRSGLAPTIHAAKQAVTHRHVLVDDHVVDRNAYQLHPGQVVAISSERSPALASMAQKADVTPPPYLACDRDSAKVTLTRDPMMEEIPVPVEVTRVIEYYAR